MGINDAQTKAAAIVAAAGSGSRMGAGLPKQFMPLCGVPVLARTLRALAASPLVEVILPVVPESGLEPARRLIRDWGLTKCLPPLAGAEFRRDSVRRGFESLPPSPLVLIHDGARPFVDAGMIERCLDAALSTGAALCAVQPAETVKHSGDGRLVSSTLDRRFLWLAQTPQAFRREILADAYRRLDPGREHTDEAALVEEAGYPVAIVPGGPENIKITRPLDMALAGAILEAGSAAAAAGETP